LVLAVFIIFRLRSVLGQRTGHERPPVEPVRRDGPSSTGDKVIPLPSRNVEQPATATPDRAEFRWTGFAPEGSDLARAFDEIAAADRAFDPKSFAVGAKAAYEMIVNAFNEGDRKSLKTLLSREVYDSFVQAIGEREGRGETVQSNFVSIDKADITGAVLKGRVAHVAVRFVSQMISATKDRSGAIIDGSLDKITEVTDLWTFARDTGSSDPNWRLVATEEA
jgi:predicted lipid-binding transport protein (Tim44 family)